MAASISSTHQDLRRWVDSASIVLPAVDPADLTVDALDAWLKDVPNAHVTSVEINRTGMYETPLGFETDLPDFLDIRVSVTSPAGHVAHVTLWAPFMWNGRFLGLGGGGNRTEAQWMALSDSRTPTLRDGLRNGYAVATTDGAIRDERFAAWGLNIDTHEIDLDLAENWHVRSNHEMAIVGKRLVARIYDKSADYSYMLGASGGGRQTLAQARHFPEDFDGYWADCPAVNWTKMHVAQMWPPLVMKELSNPLPAAKMEAFRLAAIGAHDAEDGLIDGVITATPFAVWDARLLIGTLTTAGPITERDAEVMNLIWQGPRSADGEWLWYGPPIDSECVGTGPWNLGLAQTAMVDGVLTPIPFLMSLEWIQSWVLRDPAWDWTTLTFEQFDEIFERSVREFARFDASDPDYRDFVNLGRRLLLSHGTADEVIPAQGTVRLYSAIRDELGTAAVDGHFRFYLTPGDVHTSLQGYGPGLSLAAGMSALVSWVESGDAPDILSAVRTDAHTHQVVTTRPIAPYPKTATYLGGDPSLPSSHSFS